MEIEIDLENIASVETVINILGKALDYSDEKYWGKNWDAFNDILCCIDTGGIYGTNKIISLPVVFLIRNFQEFKYQAPNDFEILLDILNKEKINNSGFDFKFI
jgi:RNAse (barnase) inhibitor barstar